MPASTIFDTATGGVTTNDSLFSVVSDAALRGRWTFNGDKVVWTSGTAFTVTDESGNVNTGTAAGTWAIATGPMPGIRGQALSFNSNRINCGQAASLDDLELQGGGGMTICFWARPTTAITTTIISKGIDSNNGRWRIASSTSTTPMRLSFNKDAVTTDGNAQWSGCFILNEWHHYCFTWDGTTTFATGAKLYRDGYLMDASATTDAVGAFRSDGTNDLTIGGDSFLDSYVGGLDDVRVYNRVLTQTEVRTILNAGRMIFTASPGHTITTQTMDLFADFSAAVHGQLPTAVDWANCFHGSGWTAAINPTPLVGVFYDITTAAHSIVDPVTVGATTYTTSAAGMMADPSIGSATEYLRLSSTVDRDTISFSFDIMATLPTTDSSSYDIFYPESNDGSEAFVMQLRPGNGWRSHNLGTAPGVGGDVIYYPYTWYHITGIWNRNAASYLYFYIGDELVGISSVILSDKQVNRIKFGNANDHSGTGSGGKIYITNVKVKNDGSVFPIVA